MHSSLRSLLRQNAPNRIKALIQRIRGAVAPPPIDEAVLAEYRFAPDPNAKTRLTFVIPNLNEREAFGGVTTGIEVFLNLAAGLREARPLDLRLVLTDHDQSTATDIFTRRADAMGFAPAGIEILKVRSRGETIAIRPAEIFVTYNWWTTLNICPLLDRQAEHFGQPLMPLVYLIQEYEPVIFPFSSGHMLAREAYDTPERLWGIFNSANLKAYFELQGHYAERSWTFEPVISDSLRPFLGQVVSSRRKRQILLYGRPSVNRNCFPALVRGLRAWATLYPQYADWSVVSAGTPHEPVDLGDGRQIMSLGKLPLEDYGRLLLESSVGISLMASPHPSYPPLEMAHFGLRVVTNRYTCKNLAGYHPNIISIASIAAGPLAEGIAQACDLSDEPPLNHHNPDFVRDRKYPFMADLASAVLGVMGDRG